MNKNLILKTKIIFQYAHFIHNVRKNFNSNHIFTRAHESFLKFSLSGENTKSQSAQKKNKFSIKKCQNQELK